VYILLPVSATCITYLVFLGLVIITFCQEYKFSRPSLQCVNVNTHNADLQRQLCVGYGKELFATKDPTPRKVAAVALTRGAPAPVYFQTLPDACGPQCSHPLRVNLSVLHPLDRWQNSTSSLAGRDISFVNYLGISCDVRVIGNVDK
jgi:hypothetical protein